MSTCRPYCFCGVKCFCSWELQEIVCVDRAHPPVYLPYARWSHKGGLTGLRPEVLWLGDRRTQQRRAMAGYGCTHVRSTVFVSTQSEIILRHDVDSTSTVAMFRRCRPRGQILSSNRRGFHAFSCRLSIWGTNRRHFAETFYRQNFRVPSQRIISNWAEQRMTSGK